MRQVLPSATASIKSRKQNLRQQYRADARKLKPRPRRAQERAARAPAAVEHERVHDSVGADA